MSAVSTRRRLGLAALGLALLGAVGFVVLRAGPLAPTRVTLARAELRALTPALFGLGTVEARRSVLVGPTAPGRVARVLVDVGQSVNAGDLLAEIDPVDLDQRTAALQASVARADSGVAAAQAQRQDAAARRELAATNLQRDLALRGQDFISASALQARQQAQASADAALAAADANLLAARQDRVRVDQELAGLRQQRANLRLLAPAAGLVVARDAEPGTTVVAGQAVLRLVDPGSLWLRVRIDQGRSAGLRAGLPARIVLRSQPSAPLSGQVARVETLGDSVTEERIATVSFQSVPPGLAVGELAEVTIALPAAAPAPTVPNAALQTWQGQTGVWLLRDGRLHFTPVRAGVADLDGRVQVLEGLAADTEVVVHTERELREDQRVRVVDSLAPGQS